jgi:integrase
MLRDATRDGLLARNPADAAELPRAHRRKPATWKATEVAAFLHEVRNDDLFALWRLLASTGARRGEALGARWSDLDTLTGDLTIRQTVIAIDGRVQFGTPKSDRGEGGARAIPLDAETLAALRTHRVRQNEQRLAMGAAYADADLIFARFDGSPIRPDYISRQFAELVADVGLPALTPHGLRHSWATIAIASGISPRIVQERLGHADVGITLRMYVHPQREDAREAAERVAALFGMPR